MTASALAKKPPSRAPGAAFILKKALISALVALVLFSLMIGVRTEAGSDGQLTYFTRFGDLAAIVGAVFGGIGSLPGAMLGGLVIGLIETFWSAYFTIEYKDVAAFSMLAIVLIFFPTGLLGRPEVEKV